MFTINVDGSDQQRLTTDPPNDPRFDFAPDWQPLRDHHGHGRSGRDRAARRSCRS